MKIYFSGAHSVGKSTIAKHISEKYKLPLISEIARVVASERELNFNQIRSNIDICNSYQDDVFNRQIQEEQKYIDKSFVADRSIIDNLAYSAQHTNILNKSLNDPLFKDYLEKLKANDTIIFFVRPSTATCKTTDGVREEPIWNGIVAIDAMIKVFLEMFSLRYFQISSDSIQERIKIVDAVLSIVM
jgi:adenylate kinase family enzyme